MAFLPMYLLLFFFASSGRHAGTDWVSPQYDPRPEYVLAQE
jgi:hypothetical protein